MSEVVTAQVTTKNVYPKDHPQKGQVRFAFQGFEGAKEDEVSVEIQVTVPSSFEEAASPDFYNGETNAVKALQEDWKRRSVNAARPLLRDSEVELDWQKVAQDAAESYEPGRKGGFTPKASAEQLQNLGATDEVLAYLATLGVKIGA